MGTEDQKEEFLMKKLRHQCSKFGFKLEDLPEKKQEELEERVKSIADSGDMKEGAVKELRKSLAG